MLIFKAKLCVTSNNWVLAQLQGNNNTRLQTNLDCSPCTVPSHSKPLPVKPGQHVQLNEPSVSAQSAYSSQGSGTDAHSSMSIENTEACLLIVLLIDVHIAN